MIDSIQNTCFDHVKTTYPSGIPVNPHAFSEAASNDDGESINFRGFGNNHQSHTQKETWVNKTKKLAWSSIYSGIAELVFKLATYFVSKSEDEESWWTKANDATDSLAGTFTNMYRNMIYAREDDNLGAVNKAKEVFNDTKTHWLTKKNIWLQTKGRFLIPLLSLISPELANDIDQGIFSAIDSAWFRKLSLNSGFYPGIVQDLLSKWFSKKDETRSNPHPPTWKFVREQFSNHLEKAKESWRSYRSESNKDSKDKYLLTFSKYMDQATSIIMPIICLPSNIFGDTIRPILRRLQIAGLFRNFVRILSVADRSLLGINYVFRFLIPDRKAESNLGITHPFRSTNLYIGSLIGDIIDFPLTIFEDRIKESSNFIQHSVEVMRLLKNSAFNMYWSGRRILRADEVKKSSV